MRFLSLRPAFLAFTVGLMCVAAPALAQSPLSAPMSQTAPDFGSFLRTKSTKAHRSANDVGWDCLAAATLVNSGDESARERLNVALKEMLDRGVRVTDGTLQWRPNPNASQEAKCGPGGWDSFGSGKCNGPETVYTFQAGVGIACIALAGKALNQPDLIKEAQKSLRHWDAHRTRTIPGCKSCTYYWESDNPNGVNRYVRNLNLFMGFAAAATGWAAGDAARLEDGRASVRADIWERMSGNAGYLGHLDPLYRTRKGENERIENHAPTVALLAEWIGRWTNFPAAREHALKVWGEWAFCTNNQCMVNGCRHWGADPAKCQETATFAHCAFRDRSEQSARLCTAILQRSKSVPPYGIWSYATGGSAAPAHR